MKKRISVCILTLALLLSCLPLSAVAEEEALPGFQRNHTNITFTDVQSGDWFAPTVRTAVEYGIMDGIGGNRYDPSGTVTIAQAVKIAACIHAICQTGRADFPAGTPWYQPYVEYARAQGLVTASYPDYDKAATRRQVAEIFVAALPGEALPDRNTVADNAIPDVLSNDSTALQIYRLYRAGILQGSDSIHSYKPDTTVQRSEISAIVSRLIVPAQRLSFSMPTAYTLAAPAFTGAKIETYCNVTLSWSKVSGAEGYTLCVSDRVDGDYRYLPSVSDANVTSRAVSVDSLGTYFFKIAAYRMVDGKTVTGAYSLPTKVEVTVPGESAYAAARKQAVEYLGPAASVWGWGSFQYSYYDMDRNGVPEMFVRASDAPDSIAALYTYRNGHAVCLYVCDLSDMPDWNQYFQWYCGLLNTGIIYFELVKDDYDSYDNLIREVIGADFCRLSSDKSSLVLAESIVWDASLYGESCWESTTVSSRSYLAGSRTGFRSISGSYFDSLYYDFAGYGTPVPLTGWDWYDF